ncbi:hypothetical protein EHS39_32895 [Ensifer sp. MPMI2T]|nr:hypothetical protein EHS39_32895 [Ensifer sp. MPMI2T]
MKMAPFLFPMTPEAAARAAFHRERAEDYRTRFALMTDESLVATAGFYMRQMTPVDYAPGEPIYDATMWHAILPELMRRVAGRGGAV